MRFKASLILFGVISIFVTGTLFCFYLILNEELSMDLSESLVNSIKINTDRESTNMLMYLTYDYNPETEKIGDRKPAHYTYVDTAFTYQIKIVDRETFFKRAFQTIILELGELHADSLNTIVDSLLIDRSIYAKTSIAIHASHHTKLNDLSRDTTQMSITHTASVLGQGDFEDINYYAYMDTSFYTYWKLMPSWIYLIVIMEFIAIILFICQWNVKKQKSNNAIEKLGNGDYRIANIIFETENKRLLNDGKDVNLSPQPNCLLCMFLEAKNHQVNKKAIQKQFWPNNDNATTNMTTIIKRLKDILSDMECKYSITEDLTNKDYYKLTLKK